MTLGYERVRATGVQPEQPPTYQQPQPQQPSPPPPQQPEQPSYAPPPPAYSPPAYGGPPGQYGYDYYEEEAPPSATRWILIGCVGLTLLCCCGVVAGLLIIDGADLWCDIPIFKDTVTPIVFRIGQALGMVSGGGPVCP